MLVSKDFIFLNFPKTGSSFVRASLKELNEELSMYEKFFARKRIVEVLLPSVRIRNRNHSKKDAHVIYYQLKEAQRRKHVYSVIRNPIHRMISYYEYGFWKGEGDLPIKMEELKEMYAEFPNISFSEYLHLMNSKKVLSSLFPLIDFNECELGFQSLFFLLFFLKDPSLFFKNADFSINLIRRSLGNVEFLYSEDLNNGLLETLSNHGYKKEKIEFIRMARRVNVSIGSEKPLDYYYSDDDLKFLIEKESLLFELFPSYANHEIVKKVFS